MHTVSTPLRRSSAQKRRSAVPQPRSRLLWGLPFIAALLPIALLSVVTYRIASQAVETLVEANNLSEATGISELIARDISSIVSVAEGVAALPGTADAAAVFDDTIQSRLKAIVYAYPQIERAFMTDPSGLLWIDYPSAPGGYAIRLDDEDWFKDVDALGKPTVSPVYISRLSSELPVVAIAVPVTDAGGKRVGILVLEYSLKHFTKWLQSGKLSTQGYAYVVDSRGTLAGHPKLSLQKTMRKQYAQVPALIQAQGGSIVETEYVDPATNVRMSAVFLPFTVGRDAWVVVTQQAVYEAYAPLVWVRNNIVLAGVALTLLTLGFVVALARVSARADRLNRELSASNQKLRDVASIVDSSNDAIVGLTLKGEVKTWNVAAERMYGRTSEQMLGHPVFTVVPSANEGAMRRLLKRIHHGEKVKQEEAVHSRGDGSLFPVSITLSPVLDADGEVIGASAILRDITERKQVDQMKSDFISIVSHQLKAPVTAMSWMIEMLMDGSYGVLPEPVKKCLTDMQDIVKQNYRLITDILNVSRIDRGVIAVELKPANLVDVVEQAVRSYRPTFISKKLELVVEHPEGPLTVLCDPDKLAEAIGNSVSNALKHTPTGSITVRTRKGAKHGTAEIDVTDTGEGMPPEVLKKLFTRDQILGGSASPESSAGLGLYITRHFMQLQRGDVTASAVPGKGSTFTYVIQLA